MFLIRACGVPKPSFRTYTVGDFFRAINARVIYESLTPVRQGGYFVSEPRIVRRIEVVDPKRTHSPELDDRLLVEPDVMRCALHVVD
jgi:hypothetical protein